MPEQYDGEAAVHRARALLDSGEIGGSLIRASGRIERAVAVQTPDARRHSWFVPVTVGDRLVGFFQFLPDLTLMRYSSFQRRDDSMEGCPAAELWLDEAAILGRIREKARPGETVGQPFLTYDRTPSRLAWAAILTSADGTTRTLHAAGRAIWEAVDTRIDSFGGPPR